MNIYFFAPSSYAFLDTELKDKSEWLDDSSATDYL